MVSDTGHNAIVIRISETAAKALAARLRKSYKDGARWVVIELSQHGYFASCRSFRAYRDAQRYVLSAEGQRAIWIIKTLTHIAKLLNRVRYTYWSPEQLKTVHNLLLDRYGIFCNSNAFDSQSFLLGDYLPVQWKTLVTPDHFLVEYCVQLIQDDNTAVTGRQNVTFSFPTVAATMSQLPFLSFGRQGRLFHNSGVIVFGRVTSSLSALIGENGLLLLYRGKVAKDGRIDWATIEAFHDPYEPISLKATAIVRFYKKTKDVAIFNSELKRVRLSLNETLPMEELWDQRPIFFLYTHK